VIVDHGDQHGDVARAGDGALVPALLAGRR
jgi:hypothetical protein